MLMDDLAQLAQHFTIARRLDAFGRGQRDREEACSVFLLEPPKVIEYAEIVTE